MLYVILCYHDESDTANWSAEHDAAMTGRLNDVHARWAGQIGPVAGLMPSTSATVLRKSDGAVLDGPYAETKEQLLGVYVIDVTNLAQALEIARDLARVDPGGAYELRPIMSYYPDRATADDSDT